MRCSNRGWLVLSPMMLSAILAGLPPAEARSAELLPPDAPGITRPAEYSFGSATQSKDWRATVQVLDQLERRFGEKSVQILIRISMRPLIRKPSRRTMTSSSDAPGGKNCPSIHSPRPTRPGPSHSSVQTDARYLPLRRLMRPKAPVASCRSTS